MVHSLLSSELCRAGASLRAWSNVSTSLGCGCGRDRDRDRDPGPTDAHLTWLARSGFLVPATLSLFNQFLFGGFQLIQ